MEKTLPMDFGGGRNWAGGLLETAQTGLEKKRGVPRLHENMLPGNSFPQICVVSGTIMWKSARVHKST
jgi:hypothetical protein